MPSAGGPKEIDMDVIITTLVLLVIAVVAVGFFTFCVFDNMKSVFTRLDTNAERWHSHQYEVKEMRRTFQRELLAAAELYTRRVRSLAEAIGYEEHTILATKSGVVWKKKGRKHA
jgi:hypothetical protein